MEECQVWNQFVTWKYTTLGDFGVKSVPGKIFPQSNDTFYFDENGKIESQMFTGHDPL